MKIQVPTIIRMLSLVFFCIFLGFNGVQQYVTSFFAERGTPEVGFQSLILVYLFFIITNPLAAWIVGKYGQKPAMIVGSLTYIGYILALALNHITLLYVASAILGVGAALLWIGQNSYLICASEKASVGKNSGFFYTVFFLGSWIGILSVGFLITRLSFQTSFLLAMAIPIAGVILLMALPALPKEPQKNQFALMRKAVRSPYVLRFAMVWLVVNFLFGLALGILPLQIKDTVGLGYVGILTSLFYVLPIAFAWLIGRMSDRKGRAPMLMAMYALLLGGFLFLLISGAPTLLLGIVFLAVAWTCSYPLLPALANDLGVKGKNFESLMAVFLMAQNVGVVLSLFLGRMLSDKPMPIYIIGIILVACSFFLVISLLRKNPEELRAKIAQTVQG